jgi:hypothetical protein
MKTQNKKNEKVVTHCGNPITSEDTCNVLAKKKTYIGYSYVTAEDIQDEEWHQIHDDFNEAKRNGEIE